jgi:hypothetical protein
VPNIAFSGNSTADEGYLHVLEKNNPTTHNISNERIPCSRTLLELPQGSHLAKKLSTFSGTQRFITVFTRPRYRTISRARQTQSLISHYTSLRFISILSSHPCLCLPNGLFPAGCQLKTLSCPCNMLHPSHRRITYPLQYGK